MAELQTRTLGRSGMTPTSMGMGGAWWGGGSEEECIEGIHRALDLGITYLDTYPELESWWARALAGGRRQQIYLQAKVTTHGSEGYISDHSAAATRKSVESSLQRLQTDYIDTLLIHGYDEPEDIDSGEMKDPLGPGNALDELVKMREEGKLRHIGIGARNSQIHRRAIETGEIEICLTYLEYNLFNQAAASDFFPLARECGVGVLLASPLGMGLLTGDQEVFERSAEYFDNRSYPDRALDPPAVARRMWDWCRDRELNIRHLAIRYCMSAPVDGVVLPGPGSPRQLEEAYEAATADVPAAVWQDFEAEFGVAAPAGG